MKLSIKLAAFMLLTLLLCSNVDSLFAQGMVHDEGQQGLQKSISYNVASFTDIRDKKLEDVMEKMPGISKSTLSLKYFLYNGKTITKYYINGLDVLQGDNSPVYNLKPEDVDRLVIEENHVVIHIMKGIEYSDGVAVNVILKDSAKGKWSGSVKAMAGGSPALGTLDVNGLNIGPKFQTSFSVQGDNTGLSIGTSSLGTFSTGVTLSSLKSSSTTEADILGSYDSTVRTFLNSSPSLAPLSKERVRFNRSTSTKLSTTCKLSDDYQLNVKISYSTDRLTASSYEEKTYFKMDENGEMIDITGEDSKQHNNTLSGTVTLLSNTDKKYLKNTLMFTKGWTDMSQDIEGSFSNINMVSSNPVTLSDMFSYKHAFGKNVLSTAFKVGYNTKPQSLSVEKPEGQFTQDIQATSSYASGGAKFDLKISENLTAAFNAGIAGNFRTLKTDMYSSSSEMPDNLDADINFFNAFGGAKLTYINDRLQAEMSIPFEMALYEQKNNTVGESSTKTVPYFSPTLSLKYEISRKLSVTCSGQIQDSEPMRGLVYPGMVFKDFRRANKGYPDILNSSVIL